MRRVLGRPCRTSDLDAAPRSGVAAGALRRTAGARVSGRRGGIVRGSVVVEEHRDLVAVVAFTGALAPASLMTRAPGGTGLRRGPARGARGRCRSCRRGRGSPARSRAAGRTAAAGVVGVRRIMSAGCVPPRVACGFRLRCLPARRDGHRSVQRTRRPAASRAPRSEAASAAGLLRAPARPADRQPSAPQPARRPCRGRLWR